MNFPLPAIASICASICLCAGAFAEEAVKIGGRVTDSAQHPLAHIKVVLRDDDTGETQQKTTDSAGHFEFVDPQCSACSLLIAPPAKSGLSMALLESIPGNKPRTVAVQLQRGFAVSGRVSHKGKPLKGILVKVSAQEAGARTVHGGGLALTNAKGIYTLALTPGDKLLTIQNNRHVGASSDYQQRFSVTRDTRVNVELPQR